MQDREWLNGCEWLQASEWLNGCKRRSTLLTHRRADLPSERTNTMLLLLLFFFFQLAQANYAPSISDSGLLLLRVQNADNVFVSVLYPELCFTSTPYHGLQPLDAWRFPVCQNDVTGGWLNIPGTPKQWAIRHATSQVTYWQGYKGLTQLDAYICITKDRLQGALRPLCGLTASASLMHACSHMYTFCCLQPRMVLTPTAVTSLIPIPRCIRTLSWIPSPYPS